MSFGWDWVNRLATIDAVVRQVHYQAWVCDKLVAHPDADAFPGRLPADPNPMVYNDDQLVSLTGMYWYSYDGVGNLVQVENDYYTHWMDPDFALLQLGVRFYDPEVGRFTQRDPAREELSHYLYVAGLPLQAVDSWGLKRTDISRDDVLVGCLDGIRSCLCKAYANAIDSVREWVVDDSDPNADAWEATAWWYLRDSKSL